MIKFNTFLIELNQTVSRNPILNNAMTTALVLMQKNQFITSGAVLLYNYETNNLKVSASVGNFKSNAHVSYTPGENIIGTVAERGLPVIISNLDKDTDYEDKLFLINFKSHLIHTLICVPIALDTVIYGVLAVVKQVNESENLDVWKERFSLVAGILLHPVRYHRYLSREHQRLQTENSSLKQKLREEYSFHNIIGNSHEMNEVYEQVAQVARADTTVILRGESGTGKELIAEAIHYNSLRRDKPFIRVNCAAIPETLIESEFFGYERGAFTGAMSRKKGRFELADSGTIFLDEIGELSPITQIKLLRVLQEQKFERIGGIETLQVNIRLIAATNADLEKKIAEGCFREDLYYRLNVFSIFLPPLRDRKTDILLLADHFMLKYGRIQNKSVRRISTPAIDMLMRYHWPGNVRELENCIERAVLVCDDVIYGYHLPPTLQTAEESNTISHRSLKKAVTDFERELIIDALKTSKGNCARATRLLHSSERIIGYKIQKYNIDTDKFKI